MVIRLGGVEIELHADGSAYVSDAETLLVADLHLGKDASFRAHSIPMPAGSDPRTLERLSERIRKTQARQVIVLGDLWHHRRGTTESVTRQFEAWMERQTAQFGLVSGNHDRRSAPARPVGRLSELGESASVAGLQLVHDPEDCDVEPAVCGHLHPGVRFESKGRQAITVRAFWRRQDRLVLPAFGELTGRTPPAYGQGDDIFAIAGDRVFSVPPIVLSGEQRALRRG